MNNLRVLYIFLLFLPATFLNQFDSVAQQVYDLSGRTNVVSTAVPFLMITPDSRSGAMADAGVAIPTDPNATYWNCAKLAYATDDIGLSISYVPWLRSLVPDINLSYLSGYKRIDKMSTFGASLRYFSLGDIDFTNDKGEGLGSFRPNELSIDGMYARKLSEGFSLGLALRFIYSNLTGGTPVNGSTETKPGIAFAGDLSGFWKGKEFKAFTKTFNVNYGINISNVGSKITYTDQTQRDFIPINLRVGTYINCVIDQYNQIALIFDLNKLLVPTAPIYQVDSNGQNIYGPDGQLLIMYGQNPDVPVIKGMIQSFYDAPGGLQEELREINPSVAIEYWYNKQFSFRGGYFYEHPTKGNRQYATLGVGLKYNILNIDVSYLIPTSVETANQASPLQNTLRFTLIFNFASDKDKAKKKK
jgi:hypothetical protein